MFGSFLGIFLFSPGFTRMEMRNFPKPLTTIRNDGIISLVVKAATTEDGRMAQLVEHIVHIDGVTGSSPVATTKPPGNTAFLGVSPCPPKAYSPSKPAACRLLPCWASAWDIRKSELSDFEIEPIHLSSSFVASQTVHIMLCVQFAGQGSHLQAFFMCTVCRRICARFAGFP